MTLFDLADITDLGAEAGPPTAPTSAPTSAPTAPPTPRSSINTEAGREGEPAEPAAPVPPDVEVRVSARRKKSSEARWDGGRIIVSVPAHLDIESRQKTVDWLVERLLSRQRLQPADDAALLSRAIELSDRYLVGARPSSVRWVTNQSARWGSCSYYAADIRISHRLRAVPEWVLDSVLVHEVAHLTHPDHSKAFHRLAGAYPRHEEAGLFLAGYGLGLSTATPSSGAD
jgi:hypothetical protein